MNTKEKEKLIANPDYIPKKEKVIYGIGSLMD